METLNTTALIHPLPPPTMDTIVWRYSLNAYSGFIDAPASLTEARKALIAKIAADPAALIGKLEAAEPSPHTLVDLGKRVFGMKT